MYLRIAGVMTVAAVVAKLLLFLIGLPKQEMFMYTAFANLLIILVGSFFSVRGYRQNYPGSPFKSEFRAGMRSTALFALFLSVFVLLYYNYIDTHYFPDLIAERMAMAEEYANSNADMDLEAERSLVETIYSPRVHATITLFGLTATGAIYTLLLVVLTRKVYR